MDESKKWYLMKYEDGGVFGPVTFDQIRQWAVDAQISPLDKLSQDESLPANRARSIGETALLVDRAAAGD